MALPIKRMRYDVEYMLETIAWLEFLRRRKRKAFLVLLAHETMRYTRNSPLLPPSPSVSWPHFYYVDLPNLNDQEFRNRMKLSRLAIEYIHNELEKQVDLSNPHGWPFMLKLQSVMWLLTHEGSIEQTSSLFGISVSTMVEWIPEVTNLIQAHILPMVGQFPTADSPYSRQTHRDFIQFARSMYPLRNVRGALDSSLIRLARRPATPVPNQYWSRKGFPAIHLLAICDAIGCFTFADIGFPGRSHDSYVLSQSELFRRQQELFPPDTPDGDYLLADKGFPLTYWIMTPFRRTHGMTKIQMDFNRTLSQMRCIIEQAFGMLKGRFRCLRHLSFDICRLEAVVATCVAAHNICIMLDDPLEERYWILDIDDSDELEEIDEDDDTAYYGSDRQIGYAKRNALAYNLLS